MAYLTQSELGDRIGADELVQLADRNRAGTADPDVVGAALLDADAEVNGYIGARYPLPLATAPDQVKQLVAIVARYNLYRRDVADNHPAYIAYRDALRTLEAIASGRISLPIASGAGETPGGGSITYLYPTRLFDTTGLLD